MRDQIRPLISDDLPYHLLGNPRGMETKRALLMPEIAVNQRRCHLFIPRQGELAFYANLLSNLYYFVFWATQADQSSMSS